MIGSGELRAGRHPSIRNYDGTSGIACRPDRNSQMKPAAALGERSQIKSSLEAPPEDSSHFDDPLLYSDIALAAALMPTSSAERP